MKSSTKNDVSLIIRQPHCKQHAADSGYVYGYAIYYYPTDHPGREAVICILLFFLETVLLLSYAISILSVIFIYELSSLSLNVCNLGPVLVQ